MEEKAFFALEGSDDFNLNNIQDSPYNADTMVDLQYFFGAIMGFTQVSDSLPNPPEHIILTESAFYYREYQIDIPEQSPNGMNDPQVTFFALCYLLQDLQFNLSEENLKLPYYIQDMPQVLYYYFENFLNILPANPTYYDVLQVLYFSDQLRCDVLRANSSEIFNTLIIKQYEQRLTTYYNAYNEASHDRWVANIWPILKLLHQAASRYREEDDASCWLKWHNTWRTMQNLQHQLNQKKALLRQLNSSNATHTMVEREALKAANAEECQQLRQAQYQCISNAYYQEEWPYDVENMLSVSEGHSLAHAAQHMNCEMFVEKITAEDLQNFKDQMPFQTNNASSNTLLPQVGTTYGKGLACIALSNIIANLSVYSPIQAYLEDLKPQARWQGTAESGVVHFPEIIVSHNAAAHYTGQTAGDGGCFFASILQYLIISSGENNIPEEFNQETWPFIQKIAQAILSTQSLDQIPCTNTSKAQMINLLHVIKTCDTIKDFFRHKQVATQTILQTCTHSGANYQQYLLCFLIRLAGNLRYSTSSAFNTCGQSSDFFKHTYLSEANASEERCVRLTAIFSQYQQDPSVLDQTIQALFNDVGLSFQEEYANDYRIPNMFRETYVELDAVKLLKPLHINVPVLSDTTLHMCMSSQQPCVIMHDQRTAHFALKYKQWPLIPSVENALPQLPSLQQLPVDHSIPIDNQTSPTVLPKQAPFILRAPTIAPPVQATLDASLNIQSIKLPTASLTFIASPSSPSSPSSPWLIILGMFTAFFILSTIFAIIFMLINQQHAPMIIAAHIMHVVVLTLAIISVLLTFSTLLTWTMSVHSMPVCLHNGYTPY
jgi:hypothetical protein